MVDAQTTEVEGHAPATADNSRRPVSVPLRTAVGLGTASLLVALLVVDGLWPQGFVFVAVGALTIALALREYASFCGELGVPVPARFLALAGCAMFVVQWRGLAASSHAPDPWLAALLVLVLAVGGTLTRRVLQAHVEGSLAEAAAVALGLVYVPLLFGFLLAIRLQWGLGAVVLVLAVCKGSSSAAYFAGKSIGRHRMAPVVSPNKTYEGLLGSLVAGVGIPWAASACGWVALGPGQAVVFGFVVWAAATVGDLVASLMKRETGLKDSGRILPGMGGMIDMLDDVLFAAPFAYLVLAAIGGLA